MEIYADNAATTRLSERALRAMLTCMTETYGNPSSLHAAGHAARQALEKARRAVARVIGADPGEITFVSGGTEADNQAIRTLADLGARSGKRHIVTSAFEHHAVLRPLKALEREGFEVSYVLPGADGVLRPEDVEAAIRPDTAFVSVMAANNEIGTIQPTEAVGEAARRHGVYFHTDAVQALGHIPIDAGRMKIDMLSASAHKFHGPKGVGFLYARGGLRPRPLMEGGGQERGCRPGTENVAAAAGMAEALTEAAEAMDLNARRLIPLRDRLAEGLTAIPGCVLNGGENRLPGHVSVCFDGADGEALLLALDLHGIRASAGSACEAASHDPSHVLKAIGRTDSQIRGALRFSLGEDVTEESVDKILWAVRQYCQASNRGRFRV